MSKQIDKRGGRFRETDKTAGQFRLVTRNGQRFALVPVALMKNLGLDTPSLPKPDAAGNVPAVKWTAAVIVRGLVDDMKAAELSQSTLARSSGVRVETINRIVKGHVTPDVATLEKLNKAIRAHVAVRAKRRKTATATLRTKAKGLTRIRNKKRRVAAA